MSFGSPTELPAYSTTNIVGDSPDGIIGRITDSVATRVGNILIRGKNGPLKTCEFLAKLEHLLDDNERENHLQDMIVHPNKISKTTIAESWILQYLPYGGEPLLNYHQRYCQDITTCLHHAKFYLLVNYITGMHRATDAYGNAIYVN